MKIEYLGHSCFKLTNSAGISVVCDPYSDEIGYKMPKVEADAVTVSHRHFDHDCVRNVSNNPAVFDKEGVFDIHGVKIDSIKSFHDDAQGKKRGENLIFRFKMDDITVCHLGDLGENCSSRLIEKISAVNVLLIPVGGNYTIDAKTAREYVEKIKPQIVIPMHYSTADSKIDIDKIDRFLKFFNSDCISEINKSSLELSPDVLADNCTKIIVLRRAQ